MNNPHAPIRPFSFPEILDYEIRTSLFLYLVDIEWINDKIEGYILRKAQRKYKRYCENIDFENMVVDTILKAREYEK